MNAVAAIAQREDHHPDLSVHYDRCIVTWSTHSAGGVTMNDIICAAQVDELRRERLRHPWRALHEGVVVACRRRNFAVALAGGRNRRLRAQGPRDDARLRRSRQHRPRPDGGAIESVAPRTSLFYRSDAFREKLIAANVTQVCGVVAPGLSLDEELIHRWTIAAEAQGCRFVLAANKSDLPGFDALLARLAPFAGLGYGIVESRRPSTPRRCCRGSPGRGPH